MQAESVKTSPRPFLELLFSVIVWPMSDKIAAIHVDIQDAKFNSLVLLPVSLKVMMEDWKHSWAHLSPAPMIHGGS